MKYSLILTVLCMFALSACAQNQSQELQNPIKAVTGNVITHEGFESEFVASRNIEVWLPEGYDETDSSYQVLYMHDGQNVFDPSSSYNGNDWMVDEVLTELISNGEVPGTIVVAMWNTGQTRFPEYMPQKPAEIMNSEPVKRQVESYSGTAIFSDEYLKFIVNEVKPFIDETYRTKPEQKYTSIMGSSMGGLISLYAIIEYPEVFGAAGCVSTHWTVQEIGEAFMSFVSTNLPSPSTHKIYFDYGTKGLDADYESSQLKIDEMMKNKGYSSGENWITKKFEGHDHKEQYWAMRVHEPLKFILNP
ncbi:MAG: alpha/beta hydrolase [Balneolaceae bacterium]|nr:alpha/beta hydrolase [Balneolaceae bacterium]MBO6547177.1 alpha/beta hydrolase [Balneolaceae bacterium]MBO6647875.1 alpha/beta hydrolase [Balneolaceae bacterium]